MTELVMLVISIFLYLENGIDSFWTLHSILDGYLNLELERQSFII